MESMIEDPDPDLLLAIALSQSLLVEKFSLDLWNIIGIFINMLNYNRLLAQNFQIARFLEKKMKIIVM